MVYCCVSPCEVSFRLTTFIFWPICPGVLWTSVACETVNTILLSPCVSREGCGWVQLCLPYSHCCREQRRHEQKWDMLGAGLVAFHQVFTVKVAAYSTIFLEQLYITVMPDALKEDLESEKRIKVYCKTSKSVWRHARSDSCSSVQGWFTTLRKY